MRRLLWTFTSRKTKRDLNWVSVINCGGAGILCVSLAGQSHGSAASTKMAAQQDTRQINFHFRWCRLGSMLENINVFLKKNPEVRKC